VTDTTVNPAIEALFSALAGGSSRMAALAQTALSYGADRALKQDYDGAVREFKRAIGLDSSPENAAKAYDLLATVYIQQGKTGDAIKAYKASISIAPSDDNAHLKLGNIYFNQKQYGDAEREYKTAININPSYSTNRYSLGQVYLATGRHQEAEHLFNQVIRMDPSQYGGYYSLGQTYSKEGRSAEAVDAFKKAISLKPDFYSAYVDLGSAYADLGKMSDAQEQLSVLNDKSSDIAPLLSAYIDTVTKPKVLAAYSTNGFLDALGPGTPVSYLNKQLESPDGSQVFNMVFIFSKEMDASSVQNPYNWSIAKSSSGQPGGAYNWGMENPPTDTTLSPIPLSVIYKKDSLSATVSFLIKQNSTVDGTIDPSHITFSFRGKDIYGNTIDSSADQYSGISKIV